MNKFYTGLCLVAVTAPALAKEQKALEASVEAGVIATSGNTNTESYKGRIDVKHNMTQWKNHYILEGLYKEDEVEQEDGTDVQQTTAEKYFGSIQSDYKINKEFAALFIYGEYERNRFGSFDYQYTIAAGYSDRLFNNDNSYLGYSIGPGLSVSQPEMTLEDPDPEKEEDFVIRASIEYVYNFSETAKFTQTVSSNYATDSDANTKTKSVTAITAQLNSSLSLRASYTVDYNTEVSADREHADTETSITAVYSF